MKELAAELAAMDEQLDQMKGAVERMARLLGRGQGESGIVGDVLSENPKSVQDALAGENMSLVFLLGQAARKATIRREKSQ